VLNFLALYRGPSLSLVELVAVTSDRDLVHRFAAELDESLGGHSTDAGDPASLALRDARLRAIRLVRHETRPTVP
jgi:hypothetical protein